MGHEIQQDTGDLIGVTVKNGNGPIRVVVGNDNHIVENGLRCAESDGHRRGPVKVAPVARPSGLADFGIIVEAVVGTFGFGDLGPPGEGPGRLERAHDRLGAGVDESDFLEVGVAGADVLSETHLDLGGEGGRGSFSKLVSDGGDDGGVGVAVDEGGHVVGKVDALGTVHVGDSAPISSGRVKGMGGADGAVAAGPSRHYPQGPLVQGARRRSSTGLTHGLVSASAPLGPVRILELAGYRRWGRRCGPPHRRD